MDNSNVTTSLPISWKSEPDFRGSFNILSTCLSTLGICVWSAVHVDIPERKDGWFWSLTRKLGWLFVGLLAPELLLFIAFNQRYTATHLLTQANLHLFHSEGFPRSWMDKAFLLFAKLEKDLEQRLYKKNYQHDKHLESQHDRNPDQITAVQEEASPIFDSQSRISSETGVTSNQRQPWTLVHSFYATMGGFVFDSHPGKPFLPGPPTSDASDRLVITPFGMEFLMEHAPELIPDISEDNLRDRSKADGFAKFLLTWQMFYFSINVILRLIQSLPISLLEVSTLAHCLCMLLTCVLWWDKPLDVREPTLITGEKALELAALMYMTSSTRKYFLAGLICIPWISEADMVSFSQRDCTTETHTSSIPVEETEKDIAIRPGQYFERTSITPRDVAKWTPFSQAHTLGRLFSSVILYLTFKRDARPWFTVSQVSPKLNGRDVTRWCLASRAIERYSGEVIDPNTTLPSSHPPFVTLHAELKSATDSKAPGFAAVLRATGAAAVLTAVYGTPHFLGWTATFATRAEYIIWRVATVALTLLGAIMGGLFFLVFTIMRLVRPTGGKAPGEREGETWFVVISAVVYISSSAYLVGESVRQLFVLPPDAFKLPSWSKYWPHFS